MPQHLNQILVRTLTWPLQNLNFVFLEPFRGGLAGVFGIIVLLHIPSAHELEVTNWWPDILLQDFLIECKMHGSINYGKPSRSWSCKAAPDHHTTTTMFDCRYDVLFMKCCVGFISDVTGHTPSKKFNSEACRSLDVVLGSFMTSWMSRHCALGVILVGRPLLGRFTTVTSFLHLWIMALTVVHWSPKALEMAL